MEHATSLTVPGDGPDRRRPVTIHRTGRLGKLRALAASSRALAGSSSDFSTRHTRVLQETGGNPVNILNRLLNTLKESGIPGPQLFRLDKEFTEQLGQGGQGNVRGLNSKAAQQYRLANTSTKKIWPVERIAIKQHLERKDGRAHQARFDRDREALSARFRAAECEVLALAPGLFRHNPNIVKLVGWGLCLDTAENPRSSCCGGLQLPLLIFERAEMNLAQFLDVIFTELGLGPNDYTGLEEGLAASNRAYKFSSVSNQIGHMKIKQGANHYELIGLLCIDIGHGLHCLHDNNFTHGDLKPENVLICREENGIIAKLCDFGCAVGHDSNGYVYEASEESRHDADEDDKQNRARSRTTYFGTPGWFPPDDELEGIQGFCGLRQCDLLQDMFDDVMELTTSEGTNNPRFGTRKAWVIPQIRRLLHDTMKEPQERSLTPWKFLYHPSKRKQSQAKHFDMGHQAEAHTEFEGSDEFDTHLSVETKGQYDELEWWKSSGEQLHDGQFNQLRKQHDQLSVPPAMSPENADDGSIEPGPVSTEILGSDDNCLSTAMFHTQKRQDDSRYLSRRIIATVEDLVRLPANLSLRTRDIRAELYYLARIRSRVPAEWWLTFPEKDNNILEMALSVAKPVDINTLAWLCAGPVGRAEAQRLTANPSTWRNVLDPDVLNESERLDRFLLLLQSGAPVQKSASTIETSGQDLETWENERQTIFACFIQSCRPEIMGPILAQIFRRLGRARKSRLIPDSTFQYFFHGTANDLQLGDAFRGLGPRNRATAINGFETGLFNDAGRRNTPERVVENIEGTSRRGTYQSATETSRLISPEALPHGWNVVESNLTADRRPTCYEDQFTHSVTLTRPKVSPLQMRQVTVGFLQQKSDEGLSCHVDLLACMRAGTDSKENGELANSLKERFPYYDDAWLTAEWGKEPNTVDVLEFQRAPWRIRTFASSMMAPEVGRWRFVVPLGAGVCFAAGAPLGVIALLVCVGITGRSRSHPSVAGATLRSEICLLFQQKEEELTGAGYQSSAEAGHVLNA
ncbi:hypothetical protein CSOJ01_03549 [Colletotrichum sojae]|uniref:Protein kinase domain-containing protein n=1 Tax=Colletotrichum sojae TaxID=2175907 RepID=A0A8H6JM78_9PEZI|nr:hypothetical protein CSOJ01_03549 [Colletotrichum sojae]